MKRININLKLALVVALCWMSTLATAGPFYVVVASFKDEMRAWKFSQAIRDVFPEAAVSFDADQNLHHVFVKEMNRNDEAEKFRAKAKRIGFAEAWVLTDVRALSSETHNADEDAGGLVTLELYTGSTVLLSTTDNAFLSIAKNKGEISGIAEAEWGNAFTFIAKTSTGKALAATVSLLDEKNNELSTFKTNTVVGFKGKRSLTLLCHAPGYGPQVKMVHLTNPGNATDIFQNEKGVWELTFQLSPQKTNEVALRYDELFHPDAAVLQESARPALDAVTRILIANPKWRIVITTHVNRAGKRKIFLPASESYFDLSRASTKQGSDKDLRHERARTLHGYLVAAGIKSSQIGVMDAGKPGKDETHLGERVVIELVTVF